MSDLTVRQIEDALCSALHIIAQCWDETLLPKGGGSLGSIGGDSEVDAPMPVSQTVLDVRAQALACLNSWCRVVIEDRDLHAPLDGFDAPMLCRFLRRHARWFSGHEAAEDALAELRDNAHDVRRVARPSRRDWTWIGDCPVTVAREGEQEVCGEPIRVYPEKPIICRGCDTEDTLDGWVLRIVGHHGPVTAEQLVPILHKRMGIVVQRATIRQWVRRGIIAPSGETDDQGRALFDRFAVFHALDLHQRRERSA